MSNFLAVATVTATLQGVLQSVLDFEASQPGGAAPAGAVTTVRPDASTNGLPDPGVNIFLYRTTPNPSFRNADLPTRDAAGRVVERPRAALDLHYLMSFYGTDAEWQPQRLYGIVVRALHGRPVLTRTDIRATIANPAFSPFLQGSDLADEVEIVKVTPAEATLEDLSKIWTMFPETPYALSALYDASVVFIEGSEPPRTPLPVRGRNVYAVSFRQPLIEQVVSAVAPGGPILAGSTVALRGRGLLGPQTRVRLGGVLAPPAQARDAEVVLDLSALPAGTVRAGVQGVQVVHQVPMGTPEVLHPGVESNVAALVVAPAIREDLVGNPLISLNLAADPGGTFSGSIDVTLDPDVGKRQRVVLLLNEDNPPAGRAPFAYRFEDPSRDLPAEPDATDTVSIPVAAIEAATYLVRVHVDGAESPLEVDGAGDYVGPAVTIP